MRTTDRKPKGITFLKATALVLSCMAFVPAHAQPLEEHYGAARTAFAKGDTEKAKRELKLSLQDNPLHADSHFMLASLLGQEGDLEQAIVGFQQTLRLESNNAAARFNLGTAMLWRGEPAAAARHLEDALLIRPDHVPSYNNLAKAYFMAGIPELAVASYREALRRDPSNAVALKNLVLLNAETTVQTIPGPGDARKAVADPVEPKKPVTPPPGTAPGVNAKPPIPAEVPPMSAAEREAHDRAEAEGLQDMLRDLPHVSVEWRGGRLTLGGWTSDAKQRKLLDRVLAGRPDLVDLTTDDTGDPHRLLEVDAVLFKVLGFDSQSIGHDFLERITVDASVTDALLASFNWFYEAALSYEVNIANVQEHRVALLARPHLTTLSGTPATFLAGGDVVFRVSGTTSGDIKPYPFGTTLEVTPTLLRTLGEDGKPRVRLAVKAGRKTILPLETAEAESSREAVVFDDVTVTSEAVLALDQTLILTGLNQRERRMGRSGVPGLRSIPIIKYLFSSKVTTTSDLAIIILLTPRDPAFRDEQNRQALADFVEKRQAYIEASKGTEEDMRRFKERYPDWHKFAPNRFASHFFLINNSDVYRRVSGMDLAEEALDFDLLGKTPKKKDRK